MQILTALGNKNLYEKLKNIKELNLYKNDVQYREGILEILKNNNKFNLIIIYEKLDGEISFENLIKEIKKINNEIKIIFLLDNKNEILETILFKENVKNIFYNDNINFEEFIFKLKNINFSEEELLKKEIKKLNKIILEKNEELIKYKEIKLNKNKENKIKNKIDNKIENKIDNNKEHRNINKTIQNGLRNYNKKYENKKTKKNSFENKLFKILIITELDFENFQIQKNEILNNLRKNNINKNIYFDYLNYNKINCKKNNKNFNNYKSIIFFINNNFEKIKQINKIINFIKIKYFVEDEKIKIIIFENRNEINFNKNELINYEILKKYFNKYTLIGKIKKNMNNDYIISKKIIKNIIN